MKKNAKKMQKNLHISKICYTFAPNLKIKRGSDPKNGKKIMDTIKDFKIKENQKNYEHVLLLSDEDKTFIVMWKWTTMREYRSMQFSNYKEAYKRYIERKQFAIICN